MKSFLFASLALVAKAENPADHVIEDALAVDDQCNHDGSGSCNVEMLQKKADVGTIEQDKEDAFAASFLSDPRNTNQVCFSGDCPQELGPTDCVHWQCKCQEGYQFLALEQMCVKAGSAKAKLDTGGSCRFMNCASSRGETRCVNYHCYCFEGSETVNGVCVQGGGQMEGGADSSDTGGTCRYGSCARSRGMTQCVHNRCLCMEGYKNVGGMCVRAETTEPPTTTEAADMMPPEPMPEPMAPSSPSPAAVAPAGAQCPTAAAGTKCFEEITWAKQSGIYEHPEWYPGLTGTSSSSDFQKVLASGPDSSCTDPCAGGPAQSTAPAGPAQSTAPATPDAAPAPADAASVPAPSGPACTPPEAGSQCYQDVTWAKSDGVYAHPEWYPGLTGASSIADFQRALVNSGNSACAALCP